MAKKLAPPSLSRRERQILDVLYRAGRATAADVQKALTDPPSYSAVRTLLGILESKGHVRHEQDGPRYVYIPTVERDRAKRSAIQHMLHTFFDGSATQAIAALLDTESRQLTQDDWDRLKKLIARAQKDGR